MSGGFFRGTSADQDTRFSNKQAKLLKSQKFASELDHLVDITKVKMDVMRPWITNRVTELLGFEDEVLINFIFGLLDGKGVNGKEVQIQLTGFMEKNTGKFMKELWALLLSAQNNASGVPQQLLDAKEEETRKKKAETDRIANEIQKKKEKEGRELEQEKLRKMDGENDTSRANDAGLDTILKHQSRTSSAHPTNENESSERNGSRGRGRVSRSPHSADRSPSPLRHAPSRSVSKSFSNSRSYSNERNKSRSITRSPQPRRRSISSERVSHSPPRRSVSPRKRLSPQRSPSPLRRRSSHSRRRSTSRTRRSPSPVRRRLRSPLRRRSRSPIRRRSRPPFMRRSRSPTRRRSPSPIRRRSPPSPMRRRSPSPMRRRSPSPVRRRSPSPVRRRVLSPIRRRSPSPVQRRSPSPVRRRYRRSPSTPPRRFVSPFRRRSPFRGRRRSPTPSRHRSLSPQEWSSQSPVRRTSPSPVRRKSPQLQRRSPVQSPRERERERMRQHGKFSPVRHAPLRDNVEDPVDSRKGMDSVSRRPPVSLMSPQRDPSVRNNSREKVPSSSPSPYRSPPRSESPLEARKRSTREDRSPYESSLKHIIQSPSRKPREHKPLRDNLGAPSVEEEDTVYTREHGGQKHKPVEKRFSLSSTADERKDAVEMANYKDEYSLEKLPSRRSRETRSHTDSLERRKNDQEMKSERTSGKKLHPEVPDQPQLPIINEADGKNRSHSDNVKDTRRNLKSETLLKSTRKVDKNDRSGSLDSISEESDKQIAEVSEKRKHKRSEKKQMASDDDYSSDSPIEGRKESKRRRKEEKRVRKEEKRRRREERRRKREYRRAEKLKMKSIDTVTPPSDLEKSRDGYASDGEHFTRKDSRASDTEKAESEQKKLEIELREKALESLRAKKGVGH